MKHLLSILILLPFCFLQAQESTYIFGKIDNYSSDKIFTEFTNDYIVLENSLFEVPVNTEGEFRAELIIDIPSFVLLKKGDIKLMLYVEPNKNLGVFFDAKNPQETLRFFEKEQYQNNAALRNYAEKFTYPKSKNLIILSPSFEVSPTDYYHLKQDLSVDERFEYLLAQQKTEQNYYKEFLQNDKNLTATFLTYMETQIQYKYLGAYYAFTKVDSLTVENKRLYQSLLSDEAINNKAALNHPQYCAFLEEYAKNYCRIKTKKDIDYYDDSKEIYTLIRANERLDVEMKELILCRLLYFNLHPSTVHEFKERYIDYIAFAQNEGLLQLVKKRYELATRFAQNSAAPLFELEGKEGKNISLKDFKGKKVYICFWAKWCGNCKLEIIHSRKNRAELKDDNIVFLFISLDEKKEDWLAHKITNTETAVHLWGEGMKSKIRKDYGIIDLPKNYLIDEEGNFISDFPKSDAEDFVDFIREK